MQEHLAALSAKEEAPSVKVATVLTIAVWKKIASGKSPSSFDAEDWKELGHAVSEYAVLLNGEQYSIFIFQLYEKYIRSSAEMIARLASPGTVEAIMSLADELHSKEILFRNGQLSEVAYTEDCLWISLEAMIKLIASAASMFCGQQATKFAQALASCAFEYSRLMLYRKEQGAGYPVHRVPISLGRRTGEAICRVSVGTGNAEHAVLHIDRSCLRLRFSHCFSALDSSCRGRWGEGVRDPFIH